MTVLMWACQKGYFDMVKLLLEKGADVHVSKGDGYTALSQAFESGYLEIARLLLIKDGSIIHASNINSLPLLYWACTLNKIEVARLLIDMKADLNECATYNKQSALMKVCESGY